MECDMNKRKAASCCWASRFLTIGSSMMAVVIFAASCMSATVTAAPVNYFDNSAGLQDLVCRAATSLNDCKTCLQNLGSAPNFFIGESSLQKTFMAGMAACMQSFLPQSHHGCLNSLIASNATGVQPTRVGGVFGALGDIISTLNVFDLAWVKMSQSQNCILLANVGLSGR